jgi:hypothetical protein
MSAHGPRLALVTPEMVERFADYFHSGDETWGIFTPALGGSAWCGCLSSAPEEPTSAEEAGLARLFSQLSPSQRRKLRDRAVKLACAALVELGDLRTFDYTGGAVPSGDEPCQ